MTTIAFVLNILAIVTLILAWGLLWQGLRTKQASRWTAAVAGGITFVIAARVLEPLALHTSGMTIWLGSSSPAPAWVILFFALAAAVFEEVGRAIGLRFGPRNHTYPPAWTWSFAMGYAGAELLLVGIVSHAQLLALAQSLDGGVTFRQTLPPEARAGVQRALEALGSLSALWLITERLAAVAFQVGLTLMVATAISQKSLAWFILALVLHLLVDVPAAAYQLGWAKLWVVEVFYLLAGSAAIWQLRKKWLQLR